MSYPNVFFLELHFENKGIFRILEKNYVIDVAG
jgi:hypothetical protein